MLKSLTNTARLFLCFIMLTALALAGVSEDDFRAFIKEYESKVIPLSRDAAIAGFNASLSGKDADYAKSAELYITLGKIYADTAAFARLKVFKDAGQVSDPLLKRQLDILYLSYFGSQIDSLTLQELVIRGNAISQKFYTARTVVDNQTLSDNQVDSILRYSTDSELLKKTWEASKKVGHDIAPELIELVKLRNRVAESLGFSNYYDMQLRLSEQDPAEIAALFDQLDSLTGAPFLSLKNDIDSVLAARFNIDRGRLRPWHYQNRFFQEAPGIYKVDLDHFYSDKDPVELSRRYFAGIGIPVDSILVRSDLYERPGKYQHAYCSDIDRNGDVRVVCNVRNDAEWTGTMLHELGHGVYDYYNDRQAPWLLRPAVHAFTTEAIANFFGRLSVNPQWLIKIAGVPESEIAPAAEDIRKMQRLGQVVFSRWAQVMVRFERALYENPDRDLNSLWWDLVEKYQLLKRPDSPLNADWASKIHIADAPVYYHNYLIAELLASQLIETIGAKVLNSPDPFRADLTENPLIGKFLIENIFYHGSKFTWNELIEKATGEKLSSVAYARQFFGAR